VSPLATLERGFAIVTRVDDDSLVRAAADTRAGDEIRTRLGRGALRARVLDVFDDDGEVV
jgi:exodeoxyribonuclease VII large subunit